VSFVEIYNLFIISTLLLLFDFQVSALRESEREREPEGIKRRIIAVDHV
jgi:hypothetical protein